MMKQINNRRILAVFLVVCHVSVAMAQTIEFADGEVTVERAGRSRQAEFGQRLAADDLITTGADGIAIIRLDERAQIKLRENTQVVIGDLGRQSEVELVEGGLFARVSRIASAAAGSRSAFQVRTPTVVAGVRGTEFFVAYGRAIEESPDVWLCVNEGVVAVSVPSTGDAVDVHEGEGINILAGERITDPRSYAWTADLNWGFDPAAGDVRDSTDLSGAYSDLLDQDYD